MQSCFRPLSPYEFNDNTPDTGIGISVIEKRTLLRHLRVFKEFETARTGYAPESREASQQIETETTRHPALDYTLRSPYAILMTRTHVHANPPHARSATPLSCRKGMGLPPTGAGGAEGADAGRRCITRHPSFRRRDITPIT